MTTFYNELIHPVELDTENQLIDGLDLAIPFSEGVGNTFTDKVSGALFTPDVGNLVWNGDGSVTSDTAMTLSTADLNFSFDGNVAWSLNINHYVNDTTTFGSNLFHFKLVTNDSAYIDYYIPSWGTAASFIPKGTDYHYVYSPSFQVKFGKIVSTTILNNIVNQTIDIYLDAVLVSQIDMSVQPAITIPYGALSAIEIVLPPVINLHSIAFWGKRQLNLTEIGSIVADPYQLYKTQTDVNQEYGLKLNTSAQSISIPFTGSTTGTITYTDGTTAPLSVTGTYTLYGTTPIFLAKITATDTNGFHYFEFNQTKLDTVTSHTSTLVCTLVGLPADSGYVRGANGQIEGYQTDYNSVVQINTTAWQPSKVRYTFELIAQTGMSGTFLNPYAFNNISRGFDVRLTSIILTVTANEYAGVYFNFPTSLTLGTTYKITIEAEDDIGVYRVFLDNVQIGTDYTSSWVGSRPKQNITYLWGYSNTGSPKGKYLTKSVMLEDMSNVLSPITLDCTSGNSTKMLNTTSNIPANITISSSDKWQPVIQKDVFLTTDYADLPTFVTAQNALSNRKEYRLNGNSLGGIISGFNTGLKLIGTAKTDTITTALTLTTTGVTELETLTTGDIDATGATNVSLLDVEASNVTG